MSQDDGCSDANQRRPLLEEEEDMEDDHPKVKKHGRRTSDGFLYPKTWEIFLSRTSLIAPRF